jgi:hypothetical protein
MSPFPVSRIEALDAARAELHDAMADPAFYRQDGGAIANAQARLEAIEGELASAYERWEASEALTKRLRSVEFRVALADLLRSSEHRPNHRERLAAAVLAARLIFVVGDPTLLAVNLDQVVFLGLASLCGFLVLLAHCQFFLAKAREKIPPISKEQAWSKWIIDEILGSVKELSGSPGNPSSS